MKSYFNFLKKVKNQAGATAVIVAITLPMLIGFTALAVDVGYMSVTKNELQNVADAAALAACRKLGTIYEGMTVEEQRAYACDDGVDDDGNDSNNDIMVIKGVANAVANNNKAGGEHIIVYDTTEGICEVEIGVWDMSNTSFAATDDQPDAVRVRAHRDGVANGPISTFFAKIFGIDNVDVSADATAALTGQSIAFEGEVELPFGISRHRFDHDYCDTPVRFYPTGDAYGCAGWNTFGCGVNANAALLTKILEDMLNSTDTADCPSTETIAGDTIFNFTGGNIASAFPALDALFMDRSVEVLDGDGNPIPLYIAPVGDELKLVDADYVYENDKGELLSSEQIFGTVVNADGTTSLAPKYKRVWETLIVIYDSDDCSNPTGQIKVVGFATVKMTAVNTSQTDPPHAKLTVFGEIVCDRYAGGRGGASNFGTKGTIPNLVE
ncbi:MAG: hypothetical protein JRE64_16310 [Deltaproteobacteria bacterium]|nr:hypothetical protein [Deltaproteobacteria bacterium]